MAEPIRQILGLGRGVEPMSAEFPGTAQPGPSHSAESYLIGVKMAEYALAHPEVENVVISGLRSFMMAEAEVPPHSESYAIGAVAVEHGLGIEPTLEEQSLTTFGNFLELSKMARLRQAGINFKYPVGLVVGHKHARRAMRIGDMVEPGTAFVPIFIDSPSLLERIKPSPKDLVAGTLQRYYMRGVIPGDRELIEKQDRAMQDDVKKLLNRGKSPQNSPGRA